MYQPHATGLGADDSLTIPSPKPQLRTRKPVEGPSPRSTLTVSSTGRAGVHLIITIRNLGMLRTDRFLPAHHDAHLVSGRRDEADVLPGFVGAEGQL